MTAYEKALEQSNKRYAPKQMWCIKLNENSKVEPSKNVNGYYGNVDGDTDEIKLYSSRTEAGVANFWMGGTVAKYGRAYTAVEQKILYLQADEVSETIKRDLRLMLDFNNEETDESLVGSDCFNTLRGEDAEKKLLNPNKGFSLDVLEELFCLEQLASDYDFIGFTNL